MEKIKKGFWKTVDFIYKHKVNCIDKKCICHMLKDELNFNTLPVFTMKNKNILNTEEFFSLYRDIVILIENEIYSLLQTIKKNNKFIIYCQILILHVEYLFYFSNSVSYGCYLIEKYIIKCGKDIPKGRLEAVPWALMCVNCASAEERKNR